MSEYQYYEFVSIDRPLTSSEQREIRAYSTRAQISATSFVNTYEWGDFKGDPLKFLLDWYDAHLYVANWGTHRFMLRVGMDLIDLELAKVCCGREGSVAALTVRDGYAVFDFSFQPEESPEDDEEDGSGWMSQLAPARAELLRGDRRLLYLAWLYRVQAGEVDDDELEPFLPTGLRKLSAALRKLVNFLQFDEALLDAASEASAATKGDGSAFAEWLKNLPDAEKDNLLFEFCSGEDSLATAALLRRRFESAQPTAKSKASPRKARQLRNAAKT